MRISDRECLGDIANALNLTTAVEVGTHQAVFANSFMKRFRGTITLVDPWEGYDHCADVYYPLIDETSRDRATDMCVAIEHMSEFGDRVTFIQKTSEEASKGFQDESVGIVYIDALHEYDDVSRDIGLWFPKVVRGGIIAGHDFNYVLPGVVCAVEEFRKKSGLQIYLTCDEMASWWAIKP